MTQTEINFELAWLTDPEWIPTKVSIHKNHGLGMTNEEFDEAQARSYGYSSVKELNRYNYTKDKLEVINYGIKKKDLI